MRHALAGLALLAVGCAHQGPLLHEPASRHWTELTSRHFVLSTDLPPRQARAALADFEGVYGTLQNVAFGGDSPRDRIDVVLFSDEWAFKQLAPRGASGYFMPRQPDDPDPEPTIAIFGRMLVAGTLVESTQRRFRHELTHRFLEHRLRGTPPWLEEGLAEYYSTVKVDHGDAVIGTFPNAKILRVDIHLISSLVQGLADDRVDLAAVPTVEQLLTADFSTFHDPAHDLAYYAGAWAFVHMMLNGPYGYSYRFNRFLGAMAAGATVDEAWRESFWGVPVWRLEDEFKRYILKNEMDTRAIRVSVPRAARADGTRALRPDEVHLLLARIRPWDSRESILAAGRELAAARATAPAGGTAALHYWSGLYAARWRHFDEAERELRQAIALEPGRARGWLALAAVLEKDETKRDADVDEAVAHLIPLASTAPALNFVARWYSHKGQIDTGLQLARRAVSLEHGCWECVDTLALLQGLKAAQPSNASDVYTKPTIR